MPGHRPFSKQSSVRSQTNSISELIEVDINDPLPLRTAESMLMVGRGSANNSSGSSLIVKQRLTRDRHLSVDSSGLTGLGALPVIRRSFVGAPQYQHPLMRRNRHSVDGRLSKQKRFLRSCVSHWPL